MPSSHADHAVTAKGAVRAVLGPTNTGKTHLAIERMLGYPTGMIGFPLRLLARENYDKIVRLQGRNSVALVTGEEKILPQNPRWWVCTVEAMPLERRVDFLAVDEIQLCTDPDRGHVFTDRLLNARGRVETMFLGSDTVAGIVRRLAPQATVESRPRFSKLSYAGTRKLTRLPPRTAVVAFSVNQVYELAETIRRQRGGTAVVLGALSPRTRNAQVEMYQAGEVDYLVATDAIGMGLNMDVDHVAFAHLKKFDGRRVRPLSAQEIGQIAGRAGRHLNDGAFGVTNDRPPLTQEVIDAVESHSFPAVTQVFWRNRRLDFRSPRSLLASLGRPPDRPELVRVREAEDQMALAALTADREAMACCTSRDRVHLLWDVCQIPDFRQVTPDHHAELLGQVFRKLTEGKLPEDWVAGQLQRFARTDGDIDTITNRIAHIRTLAYIAHRADWLDDSVGWQGRAREVEDRLSDALHDRLMQRFVDRRTAALVRKEEDGRERLAGVRKSGEVVVEGHVIGRLEGFRFLADGSASARETRVLHAAAERALAQEGEARVEALEAAPEGDLALIDGGRIAWRGAPVAQLVRGDSMLSPGVQMIGNILPAGPLKARSETRIRSWLDGHVRRRLKPLYQLESADLSGPAKGLLFQLREGLGACCRRGAGDQVAALSESDKAAFAAHGVRFGVETVYAEALLKPGPIRTRAALWAAWRGRPTPVLPPGRQASIPAALVANEAWPLIGYRPCGPLAVRVDRAERLYSHARRKARSGPFAVSAALAEMAECSEEMLPAVLKAFGFRKVETPTGPRFRLPRPSKRQAGRRKSPPAAAAKRPAHDPYSPFARLAELGGAPGAE